MKGKTLRKRFLNAFRYEISWFGLLLLALALPNGAIAKTLIPESKVVETVQTIETVEANPLQLAQASPPTGGPPQTDPNQDRFLQPLPIPEPTAPEAEEPILPEPEPEEVTPPEPEAPPEPETPPEPEAPAVSIPVRRIEVLGSTIFGPEELNPIVQPFEGRSLTVEELRNVADAITQLYLDRGYITSRAILVDQAVTDGLVQIQVVEGRLADIEVQGTQRLNPAYIRSRVRLGGGTPFNTASVEDQLRLLRADPLLANVEASLRAGERLGESVLVVRVAEANPFEPTLNIDNYSPPSVGSERFGAGLRYRNLTGIGDEIAASYNRSTTGGSNVYDFSYRVPVNPMNGTLQLRAAPTTTRITDPRFEPLNIEGSSELYEASFRQPLVRSPREEFALSLGFTLQRFETLFNPFGIGTLPLVSEFAPEGVSRTSVVKFGQDYVRRDPQGAWALRSQFNIGTGLFDATINPDPLPDGQFVSWLGQIQRVQVLSNDQLLIIQGDLQLTPDSLLPSQQFVIGGGQSLRGYRQNVRSGDNGFRLSVEDRIAVQRNEAGLPILQLAPFADVGAVWNSDNNPIQIPSQRFLAGVGLGLLWEPAPGLNVRLDYALPLVDISDRGTNAQDEGFYFSVNYQP